MNEDECFLASSRAPRTITLQSTRLPLNAPVPYIFGRPTLSLSLKQTLITTHSTRQPTRPVPPAPPRPPPKPSIPHAPGHRRVLRLLGRHGNSRARHATSLTSAFSHSATSPTATHRRRLSLVIVPCAAMQRKQCGAFAPGRLPRCGRALVTRSAARGRGGASRWTWPSRSSEAALGWPLRGRPTTP